MPSTKLIASTQRNPDRFHEGILSTEFIFEQAPFPSCHASTIAETPSGLVAAWFGGTREKNPDVAIWISRREKNGWTQVGEVTNGAQENGQRYP